MRAIAPAPGESPAATCAVPDSPRCLRERTVYDAGERAIAMTDPLGNETRAEYDTRGRLTRTLSPLGAETRMEYDDGGNLVRTLDPVGAETRFVYDGDDQLACATNALGQTTRLVRDAEGRVLERWFSLAQCDFASAPAVRRVEKSEVDAEGMPVRMWDAGDRDILSSFAPHSSEVSTKRRKLRLRDALDRSAANTGGRSAKRPARFPSLMLRSGTWYR